MVTLSTKAPFDINSDEPFTKKHRVAKLSPFVSPMKIKF